MVKQNDEHCINLRFDELPCSYRLRINDFS